MDIKKVFCHDQFTYTLQYTAAMQNKPGFMLKFDTTVLAGSLLNLIDSLSQLAGRRLVSIKFNWQAIAFDPSIHPCVAIDNEKSRVSLYNVGGTYYVNSGSVIDGDRVIKPQPAMWVNLYCFQDQEIVPPVGGYDYFMVVDSVIEFLQ